MLLKSDGLGLGRLRVDRRVFQCSHYRNGLFQPETVVLVSKLKLVPSQEFLLQDLVQARQQVAEADSTFALLLQQKSQSIAQDLQLVFAVCP